MVGTKAMRETAFDELHGLFQRDIWSGSEQRVEVIGHDDKCMEGKSIRITIVEKNFQKYARVVFDLE